MSQNRSVSPLVAKRLLLAASFVLIALIAVYLTSRTNPPVVTRENAPPASNGVSSSSPRIDKAISDRATSQTSPMPSGAITASAPSGTLSTVGSNKFDGSIFTAGQPVRDGEPVSARVHLPDKTERVLTPNEIGTFERVAVQPGDKLSISIEYPQGTPGEKVAVSVRDGGNVASGRGMEAVSLDEQRRASFDFTVGRNAGIYHVEIRKGSDVKVFRAWAGPELTLVTN